MPSPPDWLPPGATIIAPMQEILEDAPRDVVGAPPQPAQLIPETSTHPRSRRSTYPWWAYVGLGFAAALLGASLLTFAATALFALIYFAPWT